MQLVKSRAAFREKIAQTVPNYLKGYIESDFATSITLSHSVDLLTSHGLRSFYIFLQGSPHHRARSLLNYANNHIIEIFQEC